MFLLFFSLISLSFAEICDVQANPHPDISGRNFVMDMPGGGPLTVVGTTQPAEADRLNMADLVQNRAASTFDAAGAFVQAHAAAVAEAEKDLSFLRSQLAREKPGFVAVEANAPDFEKWNAMAGALYSGTSAQAPHDPPAEVLKWNKLVLIIAGAPSYLLARQPELFDGIGILPMDIQGGLAAITAQPQVSQEELKRKAEESTAAMLKSLSDNPGSRQWFRRLQRQIRPGSSFVRGKSDEAIRKDVLSRTWAPIKGEISQWLNAQLAYIRFKPVPVPAPAPDPAYEALKSAGRRGLFFVSMDTLLPLSERLHLACVQERDAGATPAAPEKAR